MSCETKYAALEAIVGANGLAVLRAMPPSWPSPIDRLNESRINAITEFGPHTPSGAVRQSILAEYDRLVAALR